LYSFPVSVLKSSARASEMKDKLRKLKTFICMSLGLIPRFSSQNLGFRVKEISGKVKRDRK